MLSRDEERALRFYQGNAAPENSSDAFWGDEKAYVTLNALLFPASAGITTERARAAEGRRLNPAFLEAPEQTVRLWRDLLHAMRPAEAGEPVKTFRVERLADYACMRRSGRLPSFLSTSKVGFLNAYQDKKDLVLMCFQIPPAVPRADLGAALGKYDTKPKEAELLLPPYLAAEFTERTPSPEEASARDRDGNPPAVVCDVRILPQPGSLPQQTEDEDIFQDPAVREAAKRVYAALNAGDEPVQADTESYLMLRTAMQSHLAAVCRNLM